jgi:hypothetical protein
MTCYERFHITIRRCFIYIHDKIGGNNILFLYMRELYPISIRNPEHLSISHLQLSLVVLNVQHIVKQQVECD